LATLGAMRPFPVQYLDDKCFPETTWNESKTRSETRRSRPHHRSCSNQGRYRRFLRRASNLPLGLKIRCRQLHLTRFGRSAARCQLAPSPRQPDLGVWPADGRTPNDQFMPRAACCGRTVGVLAPLRARPAESGLLSLRTRPDQLACASTMAGWRWNRVNWCFAFFLSGIVLVCFVEAVGSESKTMH
jgi:hypothetical protein